MATAAIGRARRRRRGAAAHGIARAPRCWRGTPAARALAELGDIALPDLDSPPPAARDPALLAPVGPLYLAHELEQAGLLRTAELIAGLFASGAITQPLGADGDLLHEFWRTRRERLTADERAHLLAQTVRAAGFLSAHGATVRRAGGDGRQRRRLGPARGGRPASRPHADLVELLASRAGGMFAYAAGDILGAVQGGATFMRDRTLQTAFGAHDLWDLRGDRGQHAGHRRRVRCAIMSDLGRAGAERARVAGRRGGPLACASIPADPQAQALIAAAVRWRLARQPDPACRRAGSRLARTRRGMSTAVARIRRTRGAARVAARRGARCARVFERLSGAVGRRAPFAGAGDGQGLGDGRGADRPGACRAGRDRAERAARAAGRAGPRAGRARSSAPRPTASPARRAMSWARCRSRGSSPT